MARDGVRLRQFGQQIIEWLAGKRIHPAWVVPGGVGSPLTAENRDRILAGIPEALAIAARALDWFKNEMERFREEIRTFANFPTLFMGLVGEDGGLEHYYGKLRFLDAGGHVVADYADTTYPDYLGEIAHPWSYLKTSFYKPLGYPDGVYRVGPLARLNIIDGVGTPQGQPGVGRVPRTGSRRRAQQLLLPLRAPDRNRLRAGEDRAVAATTPTRSIPTSAPTPA